MQKAWANQNGKEIENWARLHSLKVLVMSNFKQHKEKSEPREERIVHKECAAASMQTTRNTNTNLPKRQEQFREG